MICKWCGAELQRSEKRCNRCGKENPPLSDCGGFYDLVPQAAPAAKGGQKKSGADVAVALLAILLAVALGFCILLMVENRDLKARLKQQDDRGETGFSWNASTEAQDTTGGEHAPEKEPFDVDLIKKEDATDSEEGTDGIDQTQPEGEQTKNNNR